MDLMELFNIYSPSGMEQGTREYICDELEKIGVPFSIDRFGNIFSLSYPNRPLLSAHMDTVQRFPYSYFVKNKQFITQTKHEKDGYTYIHSGGKFIIGADDKCGIYAVLRLLEIHPKTNFLFSVLEETGAKGAREFTEEQDLSEVLYGLVLDRHGFFDVICEQNGYGTIEMEKSLLAIGEKYKMSSARGIFSDCNALNAKISCANISIGYEGAHTDKEWCCVEGVEHTIKFVSDVIEKLDVKFETPIFKNHDRYFSKSYYKAFTGI